MHDRPLLTKREAAELLTISEDTLEAIMREGDLKPVALRSRLWRIRRSDLEAYVSNLRPVAFGRPT